MLRASWLVLDVGRLNSAQTREWRVRFSWRAEPLCQGEVENVGRTAIVVPVVPMSALVRLELLDGSVTGIGAEGERRHTDQVAVATTMAILAMSPN